MYKYNIILLINAGCSYLMKMYSTFGSLFETFFLIVYSDMITTKCFNFILLRISFFSNKILMISLCYINSCTHFYPCDIVIN
ncbi:hypothetical protein V1478_007093 [Vespula squamosa]|uniref:NADH dehydrogenase subunit 4L n=1 Tax=Vespula squamosa TaxID=30214 RepID=A0ABD2B262_VESSQ